MRIEKFKRIVWLSFGLYGAAVALFLVIRFAANDTVPVISLVDTFLHLVVMPALVLLPLSLLGRQWWVALTLTPAVIFFVVVYGVRFIPRSTVYASESQTFKMLTYNIHTEKNNLDGIIKVICDSDADIVAIQELSIPAAERLTAALASTYGYHVLHPRRYGSAGLGVFSKFPLFEDAYWANNNPSTGFGHERVKVLINNVSVTLYNAHPLRPVLRGLYFDDKARRREIADVLNRAANDSGPILIVGDFNMTDQTGDYFRITKTFADTYREVGWGMGPTFPDSNPATAPTNWVRQVVPVPLLMRLDYVFHNDDFKAIQAHVWPDSGGSDHHPVFAQLALTTETESEVLWR